MRLVAPILLSLAVLPPMVALARRSFHQPCALQGAWRRVSVKMNGEDRSGRTEMIKLLTKGHFSWVASRPGRSTETPKTMEDSLRLLQGFGAAEGTYSLRGDRYTEHIDQFYDPRMVGKSVEFTCRLEGGNWYHRGTLPLPDTTAGLKLEEVWEKLE